MSDAAFSLLSFLLFLQLALSGVCVCFEWESAGEAFGSVASQAEAVKPLDSLRSAGRVRASSWEKSKTLFLSGLCE